jgi:hypothetical protein
MAFEASGFRVEVDVWVRQWYWLQISFVGLGSVLKRRQGSGKVKVICGSFEDSLEVSSLCSILHPKSSNGFCEAFSSWYVRCTHATQHDTSRRRGSYRVLVLLPFSCFGRDFLILSRVGCPSRSVPSLGFRLFFFLVVHPLVHWLVKVLPEMCTSSDPVFELTPVTETSFHLFGCSSSSAFSPPCLYVFFWAFVWISSISQAFGWQLVASSLLPYLRSNIIQPRDRVRSVSWLVPSVRLYLRFHRFWEKLPSAI